MSGSSAKSKTDHAPALETPGTLGTARTLTTVRTPETAKTSGTPTTARTPETAKTSGAHATAKTAGTPGTSKPPAGDPAFADTDLQRMAEFCPTFAQVMDLLSRRWMGLVLRVLLAGPHRFNQIMAAIPGLSDPLLTQRLRELQARDLVHRKVVPASPVRVEYELTEAGRDLERALRALSDWAARWWGSETPVAEAGTEAAAEPVPSGQLVGGRVV